MSAEKECCATQRNSWVQRRERDGDGNAGIQSGLAAFGACTGDPFSGLPRFSEGLRLAGLGVVPGTLEMIWYGAKSGPTPRELLAEAEDSP